MRWNRRSSAGDEVDGAATAAGKIVAVRLEHPQRGDQGGERGTQLVAHVRGEARLALDALQAGRRPSG